MTIPSRPGVRAIAQSRYCLDLELRGLSDPTSNLIVELSEQYLVLCSIARPRCGEVFYGASDAMAVVDGSCACRCLDAQELGPPQEG